MDTLKNGAKPVQSCDHIAKWLVGRLVERLVVNQYKFFSWLIKNILLFWIILYCCSGLFFYFLILWQKEEIRMEGDSWADFGSAAANSEVSGFSLSQGAFLLG